MKRILAAVLCMVLLCSCSSLPSTGARDLLVAPQLNKRQMALDAALKETINLQQIIYKYPQTGNYRSPFVFQDIDNNGTEEAIVFYAYTDDPSNIRIKVMAERPDASWYSVHDFSGTGEGDEISFISFAPILEETRLCMVIGWQNTLRSQSVIGVYSYTDNTFTREIIQPYILWDVGDYNQDSRSEIAIVSHMISEKTGLGSTYNLSILARDIGGGVSNVHSTQLPRDTTAVMQMLPGKITNNLNALYLDLLLAGDQGTEIATVIIGTNSSGLTELVSDRFLGLFSDTMRTYQDYPALCLDLESDGVIEVPSLAPLNQQDNNDEIVELMLTTYLHFQEDAFVPAYSAVVNHDDGYLVFFPDLWQEEVAVTRLPEIREWQFHIYDPAPNALETELLRIQVISPQDYRDKFTADYVLLGTKGQLEYYAYIPETQIDTPLSVTLDEVKEMFRLL